MERFLSKCAEYIYQKHQNNIRDICIVFPNRRSGVFFTSYLQKQVSGAVIGPGIITVNELVSGFSPFFQGDKLQLVSILYEVFKTHTNSTETFDEFYFWGEILLADFNDIDRYLVNAADLFRNVADIKEIETLFDYLTPEQKEAIEHFWGNLAVSDKKEFQKKYINIWEKLFPVYVEFKEILTTKKLSYGGMSDRWVVENLKTGGFGFEFQKYYIVGLNALNACEKVLFTHLQKEQKVEFLWDFDRFYLDDLKNEAGVFMRENLKRFPPPNDFSFNENSFEPAKNIKLVAVSSVYGQAQEIPVFLKETKADFIPEFDNTAIVLADESLLFAALGAIPEETGTVNITMGYPVKNSVVYGFLLLLVNLLKNQKKDAENKVVAYHRFVTDILNHQLLGGIQPEKSKEYVSRIKYNNRITVALNEIDFSELHMQIFSLPEKVVDYSDYFLNILGNFYTWIKEKEQANKMLPELIFSVYSAIEKLKVVVQSVSGEQGREISQTVYFRLFSQYLGQVSVAFEGEPLSGTQVMGILETRCLDFDNLIILGLNENKWPRTFTAPSFIPYNIRKGFGLPGIDEQDAMYSYYFYRLIQRAKNVTAVYSVVKEGINTGELSRYGFQLLYDSNQKPKLVNLDFSFANDPVPEIKVQSSEQMVNEFLAGITNDHPLSPSAINTYLMCSLRFYFRYFMHLPEPDEVKDEIDSQLFGNIFHETIESLYRPFVGKVVNKTDLEAIQKDKILLENEIRKAIAKHYFKEKGTEKKPVKIEGKTLLIFENTKTFLKQLLKIDSELAPFTLESLEESYNTELQINLNGNLQEIFLGGKIDRVDRVNGKLRILDYKTGNVDILEFKNLEELFEKDLKKHKKEILQALIYTFVLSRKRPNESDFQPVIYSLRRFFDETFSPDISWGKLDFSFQEIEPSFLENLKILVQEILSPDKVFTQTPHVEKCLYCPYKKICQRY
jgi:CRISPR/Cas system-associated exonuclease Cas4 (RecB family)